MSQDMLNQRIKILQQRIYSYLDQQNMSLRELAKKSNLNYNSLWRRLNDPPEKVNLTLRTLLLIADSLEITVSDLLIEQAYINKKI